MKLIIKKSSLLVILIILLITPALGADTITLPDMGSDGKIGLPELIYVLQVISGVQPAQNQAPSSVDGAGTVEGRVFEGIADAGPGDESRRPLSDAPVSMVPIPDNLPDAMLDTLMADVTSDTAVSDTAIMGDPDFQKWYSDNQSRAIAHCVTDETGHYRFENIVSGRYVIVADPDGFKKAIGVVNNNGSNGYRLDLLTFPFDFPGSGILFGRVLEQVNTTGQKNWRPTVPVSGAKVRLFNANGIATDPTSGDPSNSATDDSSVVQSAITDSMGRFYFFQVPVGEYILTVTREDFESYRQSIVITEGIHIPLPIMANVFMEDGNAQADGTLSPNDISPDGINPDDMSIAGSGNAHALYGLMELIKNQQGGCFCIGPFGTWHFGVDFVKVILKRINPHPETRISGHVYGTQTSDDNPNKTIPIAGARVTAFPFFPYPILGPIPELTSITDENGYYEFTDLPMGYISNGERVFMVHVEAQGYKPSESRVAVSPGGKTVLNFELEPENLENGALSGYIRDGAVDCTTADCILPVPGAVITLQFAVWPDDINTISNFVATADEKGFYEFEKLPAGSYNMRVEADGYREHKGFVEIVAGEARVLNIELMPVISNCSANSDCPVDSNYPADSYCAKRPGDCQGEGRCMPIPDDAWIEIYAPVCGCDGITYGNTGEAAGNGVNVDYEGECQ